MLKIMLEHPDHEARKIACETFNQVVQNNIQTQQIAHKLGALNLMSKFVEEERPENKEAVLGALSS